MRTRLAEPRDAEATRAIYNLEVLETTVTFDLVPRSLADQMAWIAEHSGGHPAIVAVDDGDEVQGFASLSPFRPRPAYAPADGDGSLGKRARAAVESAFAAFVETQALPRVRTRRFS